MPMVLEAGLFYNSIIYGAQGIVYVGKSSGFGKYGLENFQM